MSIISIAIFAGIMADSWRRDRVLTLAGGVGIFAVRAYFESSEHLSHE